MLLGMTPEQVVYEAVRMLLYNVNSGSCIDDMLQDQVRSQLLCMCHYCFHCFQCASLSYMQLNRNLELNLDSCNVVLHVDGILNLKLTN